MGGLLEAYAIEMDNVASVTETAGVVTGIAKVSAKFFRRYKLQRETSQASSPLTGNPQNGSVFSAHSLKIVFNKLQSTVRNEVLLMSKNRLMFVVKDMNGKGWLLGKTAGMDLTTGAIGTGVAAGDRSGFELDFVGTEPEPMVEVDAATLATLTTPGA
jgi:hypothetical protein